MTLNLEEPLAVQNKVEILGYNKQTVSCVTTDGTFTAGETAADTKTYGVITGVTGNLLSVSSAGGEGASASTIGLIKVDDKIIADATSFSVVSTDDIANNKLIVDGGSWSDGDTVTGPLCQGTGNYVSHTANTLELTNAGGRWCVDDQNIGLDAESDDTYTDAAPGWDTLEYQSANGPDRS